jgi:hypothetical protein
MLIKTIRQIFTIGLVFTLCSLCFAQDNPAPEEESLPAEDKTYTAYAICAGFYSVMADELRMMPQAPGVNDTIAAYQEAGEISTMLATAFASEDIASEAIAGVVKDAITKEMDTLRAMVDKDVQLVGSLYDMICEQMINEAVTVLTG